MTNLRIAISHISMWALSGGKVCRERQHDVPFVNWYDKYQFRRLSNGKLICTTDKEVYSPAVQQEVFPPT